MCSYANKNSSWLSGSELCHSRQLFTSRHWMWYTPVWLLYWVNRKSYVRLDWWWWVLSMWIPTAACSTLENLWRALIWKHWSASFLGQLMDTKQGCGATGSPTTWARVWVETGIAWSSYSYARGEACSRYSAKAECPWVAEAAATKRFFEKFM